ncbi:MAG: hypothetical protein N4A70_19175 [Pelagimonas sp.]|jgi:hypothetical protein|nr:hypothetical protein [Pelagimonas sp.]
MTNQSMPERVKLDPDYNGHDSQVIGWAHDAVEDDWPEYIRADAITPQIAAKTLLAAEESFLSGGPATEQFLSMSIAACFAAQAYEKGFGDQAISSMARTFLIALIDPMDERLDYLRADPVSGEAVRQARAAGKGGG